MQSFIIIRPYRDEDCLKSEELIKEYAMSFANKSFLACLFKEITVQAIVITWALLFIFLGVPLTLCALSVPGCICLIFVGSYLSCYMKAAEIAQEKPSECWVAESYEPFLLRSSHTDVSYDIYFNDAPFEASYKNKFRRKIVGTLSTKTHSIIPNAAFIYRFAVSPNYQFSKIAGPMMNLAARICFDSRYASIEVVIAEWQEQERDFYANMGFTTRQIYHKQIIGSSLCVTKSQLSLDLYEYFSAKTE